MADTPRLSSPLVDVVMADGSTWQVQSYNADLIRWDMTRGKQRPPWPTLDEAPFLWLTFVAWAASKREGLTELDWEAFREACLQAGAVPDAEDAAADPTLPGAGPA